MAAKFKRPANFAEAVMEGIAEAATSLEGGPPLTERTDPKIGRVILRYLNDDYLLKREEGMITDSTDS